MATRRSNRERKAAVSIYDEAKEEMKNSPKTPRNDDDSDDDDDDDDVSVLSDLMKDDDSSSSSSDESAEAPKRRRGTKRKSPQKITVKMKKPSAAAATKKKKKSATAKIPKRPNKTRALEALRTRFLDPEEQPENSLAAAILFACTPQKKNVKAAVDSDEENYDKAATEYPDTFVPTQYTPLLEPVVKEVLAKFHNQDDNDHEATIPLLNLIFRCVGGAHKSLLPDDAALDDMDDEEWAFFVTNIVDDMRFTLVDSILIAADPKGPVHAADQKKHNAAQEEFRLIYEHFWYLFGTFALMSVTTGMDGTSASESEEASFGIELLRDLSTRLIELVTVGQPDLRTAATVATLQLAKACCDGTLTLSSRHATVERQRKAAKKAKTSTKEKALRALVESLDRSNKDVESVFAKTIIPGVFVRRYRDSDPQIRASCLETGAELMLKRPDFFLENVFLKYYCWMVSDKEAIVRAAALKGLYVPLKRASEQSHLNATSLHPLQTIDTSSMEPCFKKFLPRVIECVRDKSPIVQGQSLELLLELMRHGFLDDIEDNSIWNKINLHALQEQTTPKVRQKALYFVLEQLEPFDTSLPLDQNKLSERQRMFQIDALASWIGHAVADGRVPQKHMRVHLTDFVIQSLRDMPRHAHLTTDWDAMLKTIELDTKKRHDPTKNPRNTIAKQRVLLRMLVCSASLALDGIEVSNNSDDDDNDDDNGELPLMDPALVKVQTQLRTASSTAANAKKKSKSELESLSDTHEKLTIGLLKALPGLLSAFKGDIPILRIITRLPRFLLDSGVTLPQRKDDAQNLTNLLGDLFLESTDITVLQNTCLSLSVLARGNHSRNQEAFLKLQDVAKDARNRLLWLYRETPTSASALPNSTPVASTISSTPQRSPETQDGLATQDGLSTQSSLTSRTSLASRDSYSTAEETRSLMMDRQHAIALCLTRLRILSTKWYLGDLLSEPAKSLDGVSTVEETDVVVSLGHQVAMSINKELSLRQIDDLDNERGTFAVPDIWKKSEHPGVHYIVAHSVREGMHLILAMVSWRFCKAVKAEKAAKELQKQRGRRADDIDDDDDSGGQPGLDDMELDDVTAHALETEAAMTVRMRDGLCKLLALCFDQFLDDPVLEKGVLSKEHVAFATNVQLSACHVASDLRTLFSKKYFERAASPLLRRCALLDDSLLLGGSLRFFRSKEGELASSALMGKPFKLLLAPLSRALLGSNNANRNEVGAILSHIDHPSQDASKAVVAMTRTLKKLDYVRLLESMMASLRTSFAAWLEAEPVCESETPSEEVMEACVAAEAKHKEAFKVLEKRAAKLAASLGVVKPNPKDEKQHVALFGFVKEGIRYAFANDEEETNPGCQLSFLRLLDKYLPWVKKMKTELKHLQRIFDFSEKKLRSHPDFYDVREDDIEAMESTRTALGLESTKETTPKKKKKAKRRSSVSTADSGDDDEDPFMTPTHRRLSTGSVLSLLSNNVSPLDKAERSDDNEDDNVPIKQLRKKRKTSSISQLTMGEGSEDDDDEGSQESPKQYLSRVTLRANSDEVSRGSASAASSAVPGRKRPRKQRKESPTQSVSQATILGSPATILGSQATILGSQATILGCDEKSRGSASAASMEM